MPDLEDYHRQLWIGKWGRACPGIAFGHFQEAARTSYAVLLTRRQRGTLSEMILVLKESNAGLSAIVVEKLEPGAIPVGVIYPWPPGTYRSANGPEVIESKFDVFVYESMERLADHRFEWVLPGHRQRVHLPADELGQQIMRLARSMPNILANR